MTREQAEKEIRDTFTEVWANGIIKALEQQPKAGHWIRVTDKAGHLVWECDKCGWQQRFNTNFCPDCGCRIVGYRKRVV